ncbi:MAG: GumC family protein [Xanthobacteraceae bacterium]
MLQRSIDHRPAGSSGKIALPAHAWQPPSRGNAELLPDVLRILRRHARTIVVTVLIGMLVTAAVILNLTSQYKASVVVFVDPRRTQIFKDRDIVGLPGPGTDGGIVDSQAELMRSPALLRQVAEKLNLVHDDEFTRSSALSQIKKIVLLPLRLLSDSKGNDDPLAPIVETLSKRIEARRRNLTFVIDLTAWSQAPEKSARIANTLADLYLEDQSRAKAAIANRANKWLSEQVAELRSRVTASEQAYENYRAKFGLYDTGGESLANKQMAQLNEQLAAARARAAEARGRYDELKKITPKTLNTAAALPDVLQSAVVSNLRGQYAELARRRAELIARYGPKHPQVPVVQAQVNDMGRQITQEINRVVASARLDYESASAKEKSLQRGLDELKDNAATVNQVAVRLHELERDAQVNREMFQAYLARAKETAAQSGAELPDSRIVSTATTPSGPSYPPRLLFAGFGLFGSIGLGIVLAFALDIFGKGMRSVEEVEDRLGLYPVVPIPNIEDRRQLPFVSAPALGDLRWLHRLPPASGRQLSRSQAERVGGAVRLASVALDQPDSGFAEGIRTLQFSLKRAGVERDINLVLVTSALPGEGKSTVSVNLARTAAADSRVLLIDADLRHPSLTNVLGLRNAPGLAEVVSGRCDLQDALRKDPRTGLFVIGGSHGLGGADALSLLGSNEMDSLLTFTRRCFDLVIIDSAPLLPIADTRLLTELVDGVVMVIASEQTRSDAVAAALRDSPDIRERIVGVALNRTADEFDRYYREHDRETKHMIVQSAAGDSNGR